MKVIPFVHEGLGNSSYLIGLPGDRALVVDPDRTVERYLRAAEQHGWSIEAVFETHLHADFVTGAHEIAAALGARLFIPRDAHSRLPHVPIDAADRLMFGGIELEAIASPGHTPEHTSYVVRAASQPPVLFSGGSLIAGGAARTDLIAPDATEALTRAQFRTATSAFSALPDETMLYPTHGGGSFCSAGGGGKRSSTLGIERASNAVLGFDNEDAFAAWFPTTFPSAPAYYYRMRPFNQAGPRLRRDVPAPPILSPAEFDVASRDALIIDARPVDAYAAGHIPNSLSIAFRDQFAVWLGWLVAADARLLFVTGDVPLKRVIDEALIVGYERFAGVLEGGLPAWRAAGLPVASTRLADATAARAALAHGASVVDVREPDEYAAGHLPDAVHVPLGEMAARVDELPRDRPIVAYCAGSDRAGTAVSLLERSGRRQVLTLTGGIGAWREACYPLSR